MSPGPAHDDTARLTAAVRDAVAKGHHLSLLGGGSKAFLGYRVAQDAVPLDVTTHTGIVLYEPGELVLRVRGGTALSEVEELLAKEGQALPFEPPSYDAGATIGGAVAAGLSGPARPWRGAVRDALLGARVINGVGEVLTFGGQVMKNVAGYDLTRVMAGSMGTLAIILDVSIKLAPRGEYEQTIVRDCSEAEAIEAMHGLAASSLPATATCHDGERLHIRLAGTERGVSAAVNRLGGDLVSDGAAWWRAICDHRHPFFTEPGDLWRIVCAPDDTLEAPGAQLIEWNGMLRWVRVAAGVDLRAHRNISGADNLMRFRRTGGGQAPRDTRCTQPLPRALANLSARLKQSFDPHGVFNRGRMSGEW